MIGDAALPDDVDTEGPDGSDAGDAGDAGNAELPACTVDWCDTPLPIPDGGTLSLMDVWVPSKDEAWAVSQEGLVLRWSGTSWSVVWDAETPLYGVTGDPEGNIWAVGAEGAIFRGPAGAGWTPIPSGVTTDLVGICEASRDAEHPRNVAVVTENAVLRWNGDTDVDGMPVWTRSTFGELEKLYSISCSGSDVWVSGTSADFVQPGGRLYRSSDDDAGWEAQLASGKDGNLQIDFLQYETLSSIWAHDRKNIWTRGQIGIVYGLPGAGDGQLIWARERSQMASLATLSKRPTGIWGSAANDVWIVSSRGRVHHWDGTRVSITVTAKSWDVLESNLHAVSGSSASNVWVVGDNVALHRNVQDGGQD